MAEKKQSTELAVMQPLITAQQGLLAIAQLQGFVKDILKVGQDYGEIPGTKKNTLLKPGAEKLNKIYGFAPRDISILTSKEEWKEDEPSLFDYTIKTILVDREDRIVGIGLGSCNSYESKYRYRNASRVCPECGVDALCRSKYEDKNTGDRGWYCYGKKGGCDAKFHSMAPEIVNQEVGKVENPDVADVKNTVLKMAKKRSLIDATINATMSSDLFTQDVEDFKSFGVVVDAEDAEVIDEKKPSAASQPNNANKSSTASTAAQSTKSQESAGSRPATSVASQAGTQKSQTVAATQKSVSVDPKPAPVQNAAPASTPTTNTAALSAEIEDAIHAAVTYMTQNQEAIANPPRESAQMLLKLFKLRAGNDETAKTQFNAYLDEKHNVNRDNPGNYTWAVFNQTIIDFKG